MDIIKFGNMWKLNNMSLGEWADADIAKVIRRAKLSARKGVRYGLLTGKIEKQPCEVCGYEIVEAHHPDYTRPLDVLWLCREHHVDIHWYKKNPTTERKNTNELTDIECLEILQDSRRYYMDKVKTPPLSVRSGG